MHFYFYISFGWLYVSLTMQIGSFCPAAFLFTYALLLNCLSSQIMIITKNEKKLTDRHLQIAGAVMRLCHSIAVFEVCGHLERVNVGVRLLRQCEQFPDCDTE